MCFKNCLRLWFRFFHDSVSNSCFSLQQIASGITVCLFAFGRVQIHTFAGAKSVKAKGWKWTVVCVCVCVLGEGSVTAAKSIFRLLVACVTSVFKVSEVSCDAQFTGYFSGHTWCQLRLQDVCLNFFISSDKMDQIRFYHL